VIDLHCHLLPGIDDGPASLDESIELAGQLAGDGVTIVTATPHVRADHPGVVPAELARRTTELQHALVGAGIGLEVRPGGELDLAAGLDASDEELALVSVGQAGQFLLVETPYGTLPPFFEDRLWELSMRDYRILLAHPERNPSFHGDIDRLARLVGRGVATQVTASSLLRPARRSRSAEFAFAAMRAGLVHVLASDAHGGTIERSLLRAGLERARELLGDRAEQLVNDAPAAILAGEDPPQPPSEERTRGLFGRLRR
jgi:protein-tyrosine phosphatase